MEGGEKADCILAVDIGTQSLRALIFDREGQIAAKEKISYDAYDSPNPGWTEKDPLEYWRSLVRAISALRREHGELWPLLRGIVITALRDTPVCLGPGGEVLRPAIVWLDQRMAGGRPGFSAAEKALFKAAGMDQPLLTLFRRAKSNWLMENEPETWAKTEKYLQVSGLINYLLTGRFRDSEASQIGYIPFDYRKKQWQQGNGFKAKLMTIELSRLPELVEPGAVIGKVTESAAAETGLPAGLEVFAGGSDKGCETLGVGCLDENSACISLGTTATIQTTTDRYYEAIRFLPPYPAVIPGRYNPEIQVYRGYWLISWFKKEFSQQEVTEAGQLKVSPEELLNRKLKDVRPGCNGLLLHPTWSPGILTPKAKGAVIGFGDVHTRAHFYRAIIEGIAFSLREGKEKIEKKSRSKISYVAVSGGGSQSDEICRITADIFNLPVRRIHTYEASGLGAAIIGMVGAGVYRSHEEAIGKMIHYRDTFEPDKENTELYTSLYREVFIRIYPRLKGLYDRIQSITGYPKM